jgi:hypothetical protein
MLVISLVKPKVYQSGVFVRKPSNLRDVAEEMYANRNYPEAFMVEEMIIVDQAEWTDFHEDFFADRQYLKGKGGTGSTTTTDELMEKYPAWTDEEYEQYRKGAYRKCVAIYEGLVENGKLTGIVQNRFTIVDPQGYSYARYVALSECYKQMHKGRWNKLMMNMEMELLFYLLKQEEQEIEKLTADTVSENDKAN